MTQIIDFASSGASVVSGAAFAINCALGTSRSAPSDDEEPCGGGQTGRTRLPLCQELFSDENRSEGVVREKNSVALIDPEGKFNFLGRI